MLELGQAFGGPSRKAVSWPRFWMIGPSVCQNVSVNTRDKWISVLPGGAQGRAEAQFVTLRLAGAEPAETYKHGVLSDGRGTLFPASGLSLFCFW